jgi:double-stranded uracil-DNA glycosylase
MAETHQLPTGIPDILAPDLDVVFCGINPGMRSALLGQHFAGRGNRFWPVLHAAGFTPELVAAQNSRNLLVHRCGITSAVERPTVAASELKRGDFVAGRPALEEKILRFRPRFVAFLGKAAGCAVLEPRGLDWGPQTALFAGAKVWLLPNPSGLNCAFTFATLTRMYRELREAVAADRRRRVGQNRKAVAIHGQEGSSRRSMRMERGAR